MSKIKQSHKVQDKLPEPLENIIDYLELGVGAGRRIGELAKHASAEGRERYFLGTDMYGKVRVGDDLSNLEVRVGKRGEAVQTLAELLASGCRVKVVNLDFFFSDLRRWVGKDAKVRDTLVSDKGETGALKHAVLVLLNKVMVPNGRVYITDFADNISGIQQDLGSTGFEVERQRPLEREDAKTWWMQYGFRQAEKTGDMGWKPVRLVARKTASL